MGNRPSEGLPRDELIVTSDGGSGAGLVVAAVVLIAAIVAAIWYFNATGASDSPPDVTVDLTINEDPGTETTIAP